MRAAHRPWDLAGILFLSIAWGCGDGSGGSSGPPAATATVVATAPATPSPSPTAQPAIPPGALDTSFGGQGSLVVPLQSTVTVPSHSVRVLADGSAEAVLISRDSPTAPTATVRVIRVLADGSHVEPEFAGTLRAGLDARTAAFAATGAVWVVGRSDGRLVLVRFARRIDGTLDDDSSAPVALSTVTEVVPLADGGALVVGRVNDEASGLQRFDASGRPDATFGTDDRQAEGVVLGPPRRGDVGTDFLAAGVDRDGRVLVAATQYVAIAFFSIVVAYDHRGALDPAFGSDGVAQVDTISGAGPIAITNDGGAVVAATVVGLVRFQPNGVRDPGYTGRATLVGGIAALAFDSNDDLIAVGGAFVPDEPRRFDCGTSSGGVCQRLAPMLQRFRADGSPDPRFAGSGAVVTDTDPPYGAQDTGFTTFVLAPERRITTAGIVCRAPFVCDLIVARYGDVESTPTP